MQGIHCQESARAYICPFGQTAELCQDHCLEDFQEGRFHCVLFSYAVSLRQVAMGAGKSLASSILAELCEFHLLH